MNTWELQDCEVKNRENPKTFQIPPLYMRKNVRNSLSVKLIFTFKKEEYGVNGERLWVEVTGKTGDVYSGKVVSHPFFAQSPLHGECIQFEARHIADIE